MSDRWWAAVRYTDGEAENVSVSKIKKYSPNNLTDYEWSRKCTVKTAKWNKEGKGEKYKAYIVRFAEHYSRLLKGLKYKEPGLSSMLQQMPAMLADRATALAGRRGTGRRNLYVRQTGEKDDDDDDYHILDPETGDLRPPTHTVLNKSTGEFEIIHKD